MIKKLYIICFILLVFVTSPYLIRYLIHTKKIKFLNNLYFNFPVLITNNKTCPSYDNLLKKSLDKTYSATIINENGSVISSYNEDILRIPASNLKLFSTGYVLSKFKSSIYFKTSLLKDNMNNYYLVGQGDPDLNYSDVYKLLSNIAENKIININILEINSKYYWPKGWTNFDKKYDYGAPITSLAINSNQNRYENIKSLKIRIDKYMFDKYPYSTINTKILDNTKKYYLKSFSELDSIKSNPILSLISLANAESHNFTSESLFKNASNTWNDNNYSKLKIWLKKRGLNVENTLISDASGLSRKNRVTTKLISRFLNKMKYSREFVKYKSSLSIIGVRGTLANRFQGSELEGKFFGKTGTLSNVFALSGYLYKENKPVIVSIIQNSENIDKDKTFKLLKHIYKLKKCI